MVMYFCVRELPFSLDGEVFLYRVTVSLMVAIQFILMECIMF